MQATARGEEASEATSDEACETADGGDADAATVDEPLEETAGLEDVDGAAERANEAVCDKPTKRRPELEGGERVAVAAVLTDERVEGGVDELVLIDVLKDKAKGEEMDLSHGLPYAPQKMTIKAGDYSECKDANVVVITAGLPQKPGQSRLELAVANTKIVKEITEQVMASGFNGVFIIASNPVDLMSYVVSKVSGLPTSKVIGSGTVLDTARLRYLIAEYLDVSSKNVHAYILGEHGDSSFVPWEHCYVGCKKMVDIMEDNNYPMEDLKKIHDGVWKAAYEIIDKKRATYYGIGMALNRLVKAVLNDENAILTVSTYQNGEYEQEGLYIGVPAIINKNGVKEILKLKLSKEDQAKFDHSCDIMKENIKNEIDPMLKQ